MDYVKYIESVNSHYNNLSGAKFQTDATGLFDMFLRELPASRRQEFNCRCCRHFMDHYGGIVAISSNGSTQSALWDRLSAPVYMRPAIRILSDTVASAKVIGTFLSDSDTLGTKSNYGKAKDKTFYHFYVKVAAVENAHQRVATHAQNYRNILAALADYSIDTIVGAIRVLKSGLLPRSERFLPQAEWLHDLSVIGRRERSNLLWAAIAVAPDGFCHPRSGILGTIIEAVRDSVPIDVLQKHYNDKMHPLQYMRPTALPGTQSIDKASKLVEQMGIEPAFARRYATIDDVTWLWLPTSTHNKQVGMFDSLRTSPKTPSIDNNPIKITWRKFSENILQSVKHITVYTPYQMLPFAALVTAVHEDAPPIIQWDEPSRRNPVSWYLHISGSLPIHFNLTHSMWHHVVGICLQPNMFHSDRYTNNGQGALFAIEGCLETKVAGLCLFPQILKSELHSIRAVIEKYNRSMAIVGKEKPHVAGLLIQKDHIDNVLKVRADGIEYHIDRWD